MRPTSSWQWRRRKQGAGGRDSPGGRVALYRKEKSLALSSLVGELRFANRARNLPQAATAQPLAITPTPYIDGQSGVENPEVGHGMRFAAQERAMIEKRAWIVARQEPELERLLTDVAAEIGYRLVFVTPPAPADVVFALVSQSDVVSTVCGLLRAAGVPVVALVPVGDERIARRAVDCGAMVCWALDTSLDLLRFHLLTIFNSEPTRTARTIPIDFRLGARARNVLEQLRRVEGASGYPSTTIDSQAERRLQEAIRLDLRGDCRRPFRFGVRARLELSLMRLSGTAIVQLEEAVRADLDSGADVAAGPA